MDTSHRSVGCPCLEAKLAPISIVISYFLFYFIFLLLLMIGEVFFGEGVDFMSVGTDRGEWG